MITDPWYDLSVLMADPGAQLDEVLHDWRHLDDSVLDDSGSDRGETEAEAASAAAQCSQAMDRRAGTEPSRTAGSSMMREAGVDDLRVEVRFGSVALARLAAAQRSSEARSPAVEDNPPALSPRYPPFFPGHRDGTPAIAASALEPRGYRLSPPAFPPVSDEPVSILYSAHHSTC